MSGKYYSIQRFIVYFSIVLFLLGCQSPVREANQLDRQRKIHNSMLTIDSHSDTPLNIMRRGQNLSVRGDSRKGGSKIDFPRMKEGSLDGEPRERAVRARRQAHPQED